MKGTRSQPLHAPNWLVSFGDLLTLLVCFAIALTVQAGASSSSPSKQPPQITAKQQPSNGVLGESGTLVAQNRVRVFLALNEDVFRSAEHDASGVLLSSLMEVGDALSSAEQVDIEVCGGPKGEGGQEPWFASMERALLLQRVLEPMLRPGGVVRTAVLGKHCVADGENSAVAAQLTIWLRHG